jgi:Flp pilus assembly protein TadB
MVPMNAALVGLCTAMALGGVFLVVVGLVTEPPPTTVRSGPTLRQRLHKAWRTLPRGRQRLVLGALAAGVVAYVVTLRVPLLLIVPALIVALPLLLADPPNRHIALLEALDRWVRALAASIPTGKSIPDALRSTRRQAPGPLAEPVTLLAQRLNERWPVTEALRGLADDCDDAEVDAVAAALIVASDRGGLGATESLEALADSLQARLDAARAIETERAKPRIVVRQVTGIILGVIGLVLISSHDYFEPYMHGIGPLILFGLVAIFLGSLLKLRLSGLPRRQARILTGRRGLQSDDRLSASMAIAAGPGTARRSADPMRPAPASSVPPASVAAMLGPISGTPARLDSAAGRRPA